MRAKANKEDKKYQEVEKYLTDYLKKNNFRKTPERYKILREIYSLEEHFSAEFLYLLLKEKGYTLSRGTVYNCLDLFVECRLINKHQFGTVAVTYEKSFKYKQHDHIICINCGKIVEFCDPRIQQIRHSMGEVFDFSIKSHELHLYGECQKLKEGQVKCE